MSAYVKRGPILAKAKCKTCGAEFEYLWVRKPQKYCSVRCQPGTRRNYAMAGARYELMSTLTKRCEDCGIDISPKIRNASKTKYCKSCASRRVGVASVIESFALCEICKEPLPTMHRIGQRFCATCGRGIPDRYIRKVLRRSTPAWDLIPASTQLQLIRSYQSVRLVFRKIKEITRSENGENPR